MFGDYEAQRHWMELTVHLPPSQWYKYDLQYWGLDYPPLTAYVSWLCGIMYVPSLTNAAHLIFDKWFSNIPSMVRAGYFTRIRKHREQAVYASDGTVPRCSPVRPSALHVLKSVARNQVETHSGMRMYHHCHVIHILVLQSLSFLVLILQPALLLIDFGHFQYNSVMLGKSRTRQRATILTLFTALTLFSINCFATNRDLLGAVCFTLSLGFKQMALYYAPAIGTYLVAKCLYLGTPKGYVCFI